MEKLTFDYPGGRPVAAPNRPVIRGVLGSGNLEVMVEPAPLDAGLSVTIETAATGFSEIWRAVMDDAFARWPVAGVRISINDAGATPAVVSLRVDQAMTAYAGDKR